MGWQDLMKIRQARQLVRASIGYKAKSQYPEYEQYKYFEDRKKLDVLTPIVTAIVDDGCDLDHPDLQGRFTQVLNCQAGNQEVPGFPKPDKSHGTLSTGLVAQIADELTVLLPVCYKDPSTVNDDKKMYKDAVKLGADIISNSFGFGRLSQNEINQLNITLRDLEVSGREGKGCVFIFAAGNEGDELPTSKLLSGRNTIIVGATVTPPTRFADASLEYKSRYGEAFEARGDQEFRVHQSNFGSGIIVCAPGGDRDGERPVSTSNVGQGDGTIRQNRNYDYHADTSAACAMVAGVVALMLRANPELTAAEVKNLLCSTATQVDPECPVPGKWKFPPALMAQGHLQSLDQDLKGRPYSKWYGFGRVDAEAAVQAALKKKG